MKKQLFFDKTLIKKQIKLIVTVSFLTLILFTSFYYFNVFELTVYLILSLVYILIALTTILSSNRKLKTNIPAIEITAEYITLMDVNLMGIMDINTIYFNDIL